jgi:deoxyribonuclease V
MLEHAWDVDPTTARQIQESLVSSIQVRDFTNPIHSVAGADVSITNDKELLIGGFCLFSYPELEPSYTAVATKAATFPYVPGLLSFREIPVLLEAWKQLSAKPDVIICDGQGIAHPRGLGLASHLGLLLNCPTVGCAKKRLVGDHDRVDVIRSSWQPLTLNHSLIGCVLRTRDHVKPVFVSPGHMVGFDQARELVLATCIKYRLPEPIRAAHKLVNEVRLTLNETG